MIRVDSDTKRSPEMNSLSTSVTSVQQFRMISISRPSSSRHSNWIRRPHYTVTTQVDPRGFLSLTTKKVTCRITIVMWSQEDQLLLMLPLVPSPNLIRVSGQDLNQRTSRAHPSTSSNLFRIRWGLTLIRMSFQRVPSIKVNPIQMEGTLVDSWCWKAKS